MDLHERLQATLGDAYRVERELGGGGMSHVFVASEKSLGRRVVVKVLPPDLAAGVSAERFRKEIQLAASLQHPHIVAVLATGQAGDLLYYTMPFIEGNSLRAHLTLTGKLPVAEAMRILRDVTRAIAYAHRHGVVHRDIKPENIVLSEDGALVVDFGVAKALAASTGAHGGMVTGTGVSLGTPAYMSPEQAAADPATDHRSDLYSLGVLAYELLSGAAPFAGRTMGAMLAAHATEKPEPLERRSGGIPPRLAAVVMQCLEKRPADRPQNAEAVLRELEAVSHTLDASTHVAAARPRRTRVRMLAGGAVVLALAAAAILYATQKSPPASTTRTTAVLPFANLSATKEDESFSDGMTEELIGALATIDRLRVKSAFAFKGSQRDLRDVGRELGVESIVVGSVRHSANTLRITARLVNVKDGFQMWGETYERELRSATDVFRVQDDIAKAIVGALKLRFERTSAGQASRHTENLDAYNLYKRGRYFWNKRTVDGIRTSIGNFEEAIKMYAHAYAGLADAHMLSHTYGFVMPAEAFGRARAAVDKALALDSTLAEAHATLGYIHANNTWDWAAAEREFKRALELNPNYSHAHQWYSLFLDAMGRGQDALDEMRRAYEADPVSLVINREYGRSYYYMGDHDRALAQYQRTLELDPGFASAHVWIARVHIAKGAYAEAIKALQDRADFQGGHASALLGYAYARSGDRTKAQALLEELRARSRREHVWPMYVAMLELGLGNRDAALTLLEQEFTARSGQMQYIKVDPMFASLRGDPRFERIIQKMKFPQ